MTIDIFLALGKAEKEIGIFLPIVVSYHWKKNR